MGEAHESVTEVDDNDGKDKSRRRRFGLGRKEDPKEVRSETEWVDTLVAHPEGEEEPLAGSPLAAGEEEEAGEEETPEPVYEAAPVREGEGELPEDVAEVGDEYLIREKQLYRPDKLSLENRVRSAHAHKGDRDAFYEKSWTRRTDESHEDIRNFVDNVLGTELDPSRRRERRERAGLPRRAAQQEGAATATVHVEGLGRDVLIAFTFPKEEFRSARVVYETEGGYVVEVTRAVGNDDARMETQYYTVSRVGEVGHVLDKMRAHEAERRAREEGVEPIAPLGGPEPGEAEELSDAPPQDTPTPEDIGVPTPAAEESRGTEESESAAQEEPATSEEAEPETPKKGLGGMFKRKKGDQEPDAESEPSEPSEPQAAEEDEGGKKKGFGLFKRKKGDEEPAEEEPTQGEGTSEEENQA